MASPPIRNLFLALFALARLGPAGALSPVGGSRPAGHLGSRGPRSLRAWVRALLRRRRNDPREQCLCVFDVDRTLTGKQDWGSLLLEDGETRKCPANKVMEGVEDGAYHGGTLSLSALAQQMDKTMCAYCYRGIVSRGTLSGENSDMRAEILKALGGKKFTLTEEWQSLNFSMATNITSSLITMSKDGVKHIAVGGILQWFGTHQVTVEDRGVMGNGLPKQVTKPLTILPQNVWFFDDIYGNVESFVHTPFNAQQVSCSSRGPQEFKDGNNGHKDGHLGGCGGLPDEIKNLHGVIACYPTNKAASKLPFGFNYTPGSIVLRSTPR